MVDYESTYAGWDLEVPERFNPVVDILGAWADEDPEAVALVSIDADGSELSSHTVAELLSLADRTARALMDQRVKPGDPVFIMLPRVAEWYLAVLGAIRIGAVPMPGPNLLTPKDIRFRIGQSKATAAITDVPGAAKVDEVESDLASLRTKICWSSDDETPDGWLDLGRLIADAGDEELPDSPTHRDDPMMLYFTSGTVSEPKMVRHTQEYGLGHVTTARFWHDLRAGDRHWAVTDSGWAKAAFGGLFGQWHERATVVQVQLAQPTPEMILGIVRDHHITSFCAPPTLYRSLVQGDRTLFDLPELRHCTGAGEPLNPEVIREWKERTGLTIHDGYGQTEMSLVLANFPSLEVRPGSMGKAMPGWQVEILNEDGEPAEDGEVGEVCIRTDPKRPIGLFEKYEGKDKATSEVFVDGWYHSGDKAARDSDGYFWFEGRNDDVITSSAYRIGPFEVESALIEHPAVVESAVVGRDDEKRTQVVCAFCILADGYEGSPELATELQNFVKKTTAPYKYPREIHFVGELPKTVSGKIRRTELREELRAGKYPA